MQRGLSSMKKRESLRGVVPRVRIFDREPKGHRHCEGLLGHDCEGSLGQDLKEAEADPATAEEVVRLAELRAAGLPSLPLEHRLSRANYKLRTAPTRGIAWVWASTAGTRSCPYLIDLVIESAASLSFSTRVRSCGPKLTCRE